MGNGLLAQWRRGVVARGLAAAALVSVPVVVAAAIGFETSLGGLADGLASGLGGPDDSQPAADGSTGGGSDSGGGGSALPIGGGDGGGTSGGGTVGGAVNDVVGDVNDTLTTP